MGIILFDIDGTLFDPKKFGQLYRAALAATLAISEENLASVIADYYSTLESSTDFDPNEFIKNVALRFGVDEKLVGDVFWNKDFFMQSRFEEVEAVLKKLSSQNTLGIFSQGHKYYQEYKLEHTGLFKYFDPNIIFIYKRKMAGDAENAIPQGAIIIEDKHDVAKALSAKTKTIWINRMGGADDPEMDTIHSLEQLTTDN